MQHTIFDKPTDYCAETLSFQYAFSKEFNNILFEQMEKESAMIIASLEAATIILEAEQQAQGQTQAPAQKKGIFQSIIAFLKRIFLVFIDKTQAMIERNDEWLEKNGDKLDKINYDGLQIDMVPFWNMGLDKAIPESKKLETKVLNILKSPKKVQNNTDMKDVTNNLFPEYLDENGDLTNGVKNLYRTGNAKGPVKTVSLKGEELKKYATGEFREFCKTYGKTVLPQVRKLSSEAQNQLAMVERTINSRPPATAQEVKESFCLIENAFYSETELAYLPDFVTEAKIQSPVNKPQETQTQTQQEPTKPATDNDKKQSVTKVQMTDHGNKENAEAQERLDRMSNDQLQFMKNIAMITQTNVSTFMTVMEERYIAYMNALKQIVEARSKQLSESEQQNAKQQGGQGQQQAPQQPVHKPTLKERAKNLVTRKKKK